MTDSKIFISHSTRDKHVSMKILEGLRRHGFGDEYLFLDSDAESGLVIGQRWEQKLYDELNRCACLIVVGTKNWEQSPWCFAEGFIAKNRTIPVIVLKVDPDAELSSLSEYQSIQEFDASSYEIEELVRILSQNDLDAPSEPANLSAGWTKPARELSQREQDELLQQVSKQLRELGHDRTTRRIASLILAVSLLLVGLFVYVFFGNNIYQFLYPPDYVEMTAEEFVEAAKSGEVSMREKIGGKRVKLSGFFADGYSPSRPRILPLREGIVEVNINSMDGGGPIPDASPGNALQFSGVVEALNPIEIGGELLSVLVYMTDVEFNE